MTCDHTHVIMGMNIAFFTIRSGPILNICPSHCSFLARIQRSMSNVLSSAASSLIVLPVITLTMLEFAPLSAARASAVSLHASEPYVKMLHTLDLYKRMRRFTCNCLLAHMCLILPNRCRARAIRICRSIIWLPPDSKVAPRYFALQVFCASTLPHLTIGRSFCCSFLFAVTASIFAVLVFMRCSLLAVVVPRTLPVCL